MGKDSESWLHHRQLDEEFPYARFSKLPLNDVGMRSSLFPRAILCTVASSANGGLMGPPNIKLGELNEPHGWVRTGLVFTPDIPLHGNFVPETNLTDKVPGNGCPSKQFLVFDQTGNRTTMMFSYCFGASIPRPTAWTHKPTCFNMLNDDELQIKSDGHLSDPNLTDYSDNEHGSVVGSEMREDSEEINALLYSDEEDEYSDYAEETSTGHSPSTMTAYEKHDHDWGEEDDMDEVASSFGPTKRRKLSENEYQVPTVTYTSIYVKPNRLAEYEEDAESSFAGGKPKSHSSMGLLPGNKRTRQEKIRQAVSILQTILPCGEGKDAVMVLDEAINYLKTLKFKAKSLGL